MHDTLDCLRRGLALALSPGLRRWAIVPLLANLLVFGLLVAWLFGLATDLLDHTAAMARDAATGWLAGVVDFLLDVLKLVFLGLLLFFALSLFSTLLHLVAAPFNGLLASRVEERVTGAAAADAPFARMARRAFVRSLQAARYWLLRAAALALLSVVLALVPLVNAVVPALWFLFGAWMTAVAFFDYPADNRGVPFDAMLAALAARRLETMLFGGAVFALMVVPLVNLVAMPVAVCAATLMWLEKFDGGRAGGLRRHALPD